MFKNKILNSFKNGVCLSLLFSAIMLPLVSTESSANNTYYIRMLFDEGNFGVISQVISDKNEGATYLEQDQNIDFSSIADFKKVVPSSSVNSVKNPEDFLIADIVNKDAGAYTEVTKQSGENGKNMGLVFSFPGLTSKIDPDIKYTALSSDMARAELVSNTLAKGLNDALSFIKTNTGVEHVSGEGLRHVVAHLARITSSFGHGAKKGEFNAGKDANNKGFSVFLVSGPTQVIEPIGKAVGKELTPVNGLRYSDYVAITTTNPDTGKITYGYFPWRMLKGYRPSGSGDAGELESLVGTEYVAKAKQKENMYITWGQLAIQAGVNSDMRGTQIADSSSDVMTLIGQGLGSDLTSTITSVRSMLNLAPIQELILNMGSRSATHHFGVMTEEMYDTAKTVYVLVLIVSLLFLSVLIIKMIHQKMISTTNIIAKTSLMEGLQDVIFVGIMLAFFPSIFEILLELNYWIVKTFSFSNEYLGAYTLLTSKMISTESLAGFIVSSMFLSIDVYINTTYLVRAIVVSFLFAISPVLTVSYCWGPMQKKLYFGYMRELVGNIFMQSFHAITMTFFAGYNSTNMSSMEAIASAYCFIPVTQLFRQLVIGSQGGFSESLGGKLAGQLTNTAMGMQKSGLAVKQAKELTEQNATNAKNLSVVSGMSQAVAMGTDIAGTIMQSNALNGEIANLGVSTGANKGGDSSKGRSSKGLGTGQVLKSSIGGAVVSGVGSAAAGAMMGARTAENNKNLGELQMKHSMENIGFGLAQVGAGIGASSYDAGGGMVASGLSTVEKAASTYGQGSAYAEGTAADNLGFAEGMNTAAMLGTMSLSRMGSNAIRTKNDIQREIRKEDLKNQKIAEAQAEKERTRGLDLNKGDYTNTSKYLGMGDKLDKVDCPIEKIEAHNNNTDSSTMVINANKTQNLNKDNALVNLANQMKQLQKNNGDIYNHPDFKAALDKANKEFGVSKTTMPTISNDGKVTLVMNKMSNLGLEVDGNGKVYGTSPELMTSKGFDPEILNKNNENSDVANS